MTALTKRRFAEEEYLLIERAAEYKSEFCDGEIYAMAGAGRRHMLIAGNIGASLHSQFKGRSCEAYMNDMRVRVGESGMYSYPDVVAVCAEPRFVDVYGDSLLNPELLVEVLSPSTIDYDRGQKLWRYRQIESLRDYLLIWQDQVRIEHGSRDDSKPHCWSVREYADLSDRIEIAGVGVELRLADIYDKVDFTMQELPPR